MNPYLTTPRGHHTAEILEWTQRQETTRAAYHASTRCTACPAWLDKADPRVTRCTPCQTREKAHQKATAYHAKRSTP